MKTGGREGAHSMVAAIFTKPKEGNECPKIYVGKEPKKKTRGIQLSSIPSSRWPLMLEGYPISTIPLLNSTWKFQPNSKIKAGPCTIINPRQHRHSILIYCFCFHLCVCLHIIVVIISPHRIWWRWGGMRMRRWKAEGASSMCRWGCESVFIIMIK